MKKVLFIYYFFPPILGDWRGVGFTKYLPELGWKPIVISAAETVSYGNDDSLLQQVPDGIDIYRVGHKEPSIYWTFALNKAKINYVFPDYYKSWYSPAYKEAKQILQKEKVDLIYSSSSPYTSSFVAMKLSKEFNIPWVAEFRDPWSGNDYLNLSYDRNLVRPLRLLQKFKIARAERSFMNRADNIVVVSWQHKQQLCKLFGVAENKIKVVTNGYDEWLFSDLSPETIYPNKLTILFLGSAYTGYQEIAQKFINVVTEIDHNAEVLFVGRGSESVKTLLSNNLTRIGHVRKDKSLAIASSAQFFLLIINPSAKWHLPIKLYDYLRLGKPILALVSKDGDAAKIITESKAGYILSHDENKMKEQLQAIFEDWKKGKSNDFHPDQEYITQFERINLTKKLADAFDEAVANRK